MNNLWPSERFCTLCGKEFDSPTMDEDFCHGNLCRTCKQKHEQGAIKYSGSKRYCVKCGVPAISEGEPGQIKLCAKCSPWAAVNRVGAELKIIGDCRHWTAYQKHRHHPDYGHPLEVFLMCGSCHILEHNIIRQCEIHGEYDSTRHSERRRAWKKMMGEKR